MCIDKNADNLFLETMSSSLECLVPILDGTNYYDWAVLMQSFLQMQDLWEVVDGAHHMPTALTPGATNAYNAAYTARASWGIPRATYTCTPTKPVPMLWVRVFAGAGNGFC